MSREQKFESLKTHAWLGRLFGKLTKTEIELAREFLRANADLSRDDFEIKVNRMFLDREKPKNHAIILELLSNSNSGRDIPE